MNCMILLKSTWIANQREPARRQGSKHTHREIPAIKHDASGALLELLRVATGQISREHVKLKQLITSERHIVLRVLMVAHK